MAVAVANRQRRVAVRPARLVRAARAALASVGRAGGDVEVLVVGDDAIRRLNAAWRGVRRRSEEHTSELQSHSDLVCRLLLEKKKTNTTNHRTRTNKTRLRHTRSTGHHNMHRSEHNSSST